MTDDQPPELPPPERPRDIAGMLDGLQTTFVGLERSVAGYNTLSRVFQTVTNQLPPGQRPKGLMLSFKGSVDDIHPIDVVIDVQKHVDPKFVANVIAPLANGQAHAMLAAIDRLIADANDLRDIIRGALGLPPEGTPASPS